VPDGTGGPQGRTLAALDRIRALILNLELRPGKQIRQEEMARLLGISRVPLREALRVLASEGLLTHHLHQGYFVRTMSPEDLEQVRTLLNFLETELMRTIAWPTGEQINVLRHLNDEYSRAARANDVLAMSRCNTRLHSQIHDLSPLEIIRDEAERFWTLSEPYRMMHIATTDPALSISQHEQLIDALAAQDRALVLRTSAEHHLEAQIAARNFLMRGAETLPRPAAVG
jgi:DNA-binding GntR family transcriptional regulator